MFSAMGAHTLGCALPVSRVLQFGESLFLTHTDFSGEFTLLQASRPEPSNTDELDKAGKREGDTFRYGPSEDRV